MTEKTVQLFVTCLVDAFFPQAGMAVVDLLEEQGFTVEFPFDQTCCGQPAFNGGFWDDARAMARHTLDVLHATSGPIVIPSGSCADMIIHHYPELFANEPDTAAKAEAVAGRVFEFTQFLVDEVGLSNLKPALRAKLTYLPSCHGLRNLKIYDQPKTLLGSASGAELVDPPDEAECCGFGGLFSVKMSELSGALLSKKLDNIEAGGAEVVTGIDASCLMHIGGGLKKRGSPVQVRHIAEVLHPAPSEDDHAAD